MRILFIGNSYTHFNDLPQLLAGIAEGEGHAIIPIRKMKCTPR